MIKTMNGRKAAMMSVSALALGVLAFPVAAQQTDVGAPGKALTAGIIESSSGAIVDGGADGGVVVNPGAVDVVTVKGAEINNQTNGSGLSIFLGSGGIGPLNVQILDGGDIRAAQTAIYVGTADQDLTLDASAGGATITSTGQAAMQAGSVGGGDVTVLNGANTISAGKEGISAFAMGADSTVTVNSTGGTISAGTGIMAYGQTNVVVGQDAGITTAITLTDPLGVGIRANQFSEDGGTLVVKTGAGGTIDGGHSGILASATSGSVTVDVGAAIGQTGAPSENAVLASSNGGDVTVNATAALHSEKFGVVANIGGGTGDITVATTDAVGDNAIGVVMHVYDGGTGSIDYTLNGASTVSGVSAIIASSGAGDISIRALDAGSSIEGVQRAIDARTTAGGSVTIDLAGSANGEVVGIVAGGDGAVSITTGAVNGADGFRAIYAGTTTGAIDIAANGNVIGGAEGGIYAASTGAGAITINASGIVSGGGASGIDSRNTGSAVTNIGSEANRIGTVTAATNGIFATSGSDITVYAGQVAGGTRGIVASSQDGGAGVEGSVLVDVNGLVTAHNGAGIIANMNGVLASDTVTVRAQDVNATGGSAVSVFSNAGDVSITTGALTAAAGNNSTWTGVYSGSNRGANVDVTVGGPITASYRGIFVETYGEGSGGAVSVNAGAAINAYQGIVVTSQGTGGVDIGQTTRTGAITTTNGAGVFASSAGDVNIAAGAVTSVGGTAATFDGRVVINASADNGFGIVGLSSGGSVAIDAAGLVIGGAAGGVLAQTTAADGAVNITTAGVTADVGRAIQAVAVGGPIDIRTTGAIKAQDFGIYARNVGAGAITVHAAGPVNSTANNGISVENLGGAGAVSVGTADERLGGAVTSATTAIFAVGTGDVSVHAASATGGTRGIVAASQFAAGTPNGKVVINVAGPVTGQSSWAIIGVNNGDFAENSLSITTGDTVTGNGKTAISAQTVGGDITVVSNGAVLSNATADSSSNSALYAAAEGDAVVDITTHDLVSGWDGIYAVTNGAGEIGTRGGIAILATGDVVGSLGYGVSALSTNGSIAIDLQGKTSGALAGVRAVASGAGAIDITASGPITSSGSGIYAASNGGTINIHTTAEGAVAPGAAAGLVAVSTTGAITIDQAGDIGAIGLGNTVNTGIYASIASGDAALTVNSTGGIYVTPGQGFESTGIYAVHGGTGAVNVTTNGIIDPGAYGVVAQGAGPVSYTAAGGLVEGDQGVYVASTAAGPVNVTIAAGTEIRGLNGVGLQAVGNGGAVNLSIGGEVTAATAGVVATNTGAGSVSISNTGSIASGSGPAILADAGTGGLLLNIKGSVISAAGPAIQATSAGSGVINIAAGSIVAGRVDSADEGVINLVTASGTHSTINVEKGATVQAVSGSAFDTAIRAEGGSVVVNNSGIISGQIDFSALTGENRGQLTSGAGTTFQTGGLSVFSVGDDTFVNGGDFVALGASTTLDFRGGENLFTNSGTVFVGFNPVSAAGSALDLLSVTAFNNSGTLQMMNGAVGDSISALGADFVGSGASRLAIDTVVGVPGGRSDVLRVGTTSGTTSVFIRDAAPTTFGAYDPTGTLIVAGTTHAGDFVLDTASSYYSAGEQGPVLDKPGLFSSQLAVDARGTVLVSLPKVQAWQLSTLGAQAKAVWDSSSRANRQAEVRDQLALGGDAGGVWVDVRGSRTNRQADRNLQTLTGIVSYDASYNQDLASVSVGVDGVRQVMGGDVVIGGSIGYVDSNTDFDKMGTSVDMNGLTGGAYASYVRNGLFVAGSVAGDQLTAEIGAARLSGFTAQKTDISSLGATLEAGVRAPFVLGSVIEPSVAAVYVNSNIDDMTVAGSTFRYGGGESLQLSMGARMSGAANFGSKWDTRYNLSVRGVGEAMERNDVVIDSAGADLDLNDPLSNGFVELRTGLTSQWAGGWSGFVDAAGRYGDDYRDVGVSAGVRLRY